MRPGRSATGTGALLQTRRGLGSAHVTPLVRTSRPHGDQSLVSRLPVSAELSRRMRGPPRGRLSVIVTWGATHGLRAPPISPPRFRPPPPVTRREFSGGVGGGRDGFICGSLPQDRAGCLCCGDFGLDNTGGKSAEEINTTTTRRRKKYPKSSIKKMPSNKEGGGWKSFVWDSEKRELLGRTGGSWFKIIAFYIVFYSFLAGIFIGTIQALLLTLSDYKPTWQDRVAPPGLSHTPKSEKSEMAFNTGELETYLPYTKALRAFLEKYDDEMQKDQMKFEDCGEEPADSRYRDELESDVGVRKACRFSRTWLGPCSGIEDREFGFKEGKPCLIVKLNRIVSFRPRPPTTNDSIPEEAQPKVQPNVIPIYCTNKKEEDAGKVGEIKYYGIGGGFPLQYYPYYGKLLHPHYLQPLVALHFTNLTLKGEVRIECKVFGENIDYSDKDRYQGRFEIKFLINS